MGLEKPVTTTWPGDGEITSGQRKEARLLAFSTRLYSVGKVFPPSVLTASRIVSPWLVVSVPFPAR